MNSSKGSLLGALAFDPQAVLVREPGLLLDPEFLGALHAELHAELGPLDAEHTLVQIGFLHGLRDALRVVQNDSGGALASAAPLPIRVRQAPSSTPGGLELHGCWPVRSEATARLARMGAADAASANCALSVGYTSGWLSGIFEADILALETGCSAAGESACRFVAREHQAWREHCDPRADALLAALPFDSLREMVGAPEAPEEPGEPVVQIWGPVMVIPFSGPDEATMAVELIGRDPSAAEVSVIVVDLTSVVLDEAFGAVGLEHIMQCVESWGAEVVLAGVSPLSQAVVDDLERAPLLVEKDLHEAIAAAFRIAEAQRLPL